MKLELRAVEEALVDCARAYTKADLLARALLHASLECPAYLAHARHWCVRLGPKLVGLAAEIEGVFPFRSAPLAGSLPGAAARLIEPLSRPTSLLAPESLWRELERAGAQRARVYRQMARLNRLALPPPHPDVKRIDESSAGIASRISAGLLEFGCCYGVCEGDGEVLAAAGVEFVTPELVQLAVRVDESRLDLARAVLSELLRELESPDRRVVLQVREENLAVQELYAGLGFRGTRRLAKFELA